MKKFILTVAPWLITIAAIAYVCNGLDWAAFWSHARTGDLSWLLFSLLCTSLSYLVRSYRWLDFFPDRKVLSFLNAARVLILGFFMNNILPARTGELVRAHMGAKVSGEKRTLVLATIASERLVDGLTISIFFLCFTVGLNKTEISSNLSYVAYLFAAVSFSVILTLIFRNWIYGVTEYAAKKVNSRYTDYAVDRMQLFIEGLSPLASLKKLPSIIGLSLITWAIELAVYYGVATAFNADLSLSSLVLFMVTVNFSSLIPAAPGAIGVIEAVTTTVLVSIGIEKELALSMVLSQHVIQYIVVGIPGIFVLTTWKKHLGNLDNKLQEE